MASKVYNKKGKVHPTLASSYSSVDDHLSLFLPAAILTLAASLPVHDKDVLAYFLSCSSYSPGVDLNLSSRHSLGKELRGRADHEARFECTCFRCYLSFWSRWDSSSNGRVIDEIIEAFEEHERRELQMRARQGRRGRKELKKRDVAKDNAVLPAGGGAADKGGALTPVAEVSGQEEAGEEVKGLARRIGTTIGFTIWNFLDRITM